METSEHVDAVVVGSGFGGSVAAYRLAEAGRRTVVLERGRSYPPGSFPRTPQEVGRAFWDPSEGLYGLFDVWTFRGLESVVASGLGGGSLIYANVLLRKDENWFVTEEPLPGSGYETWPVTRADLEPHYDRVERMLGAARFPADHPPYRTVRKAAAMREAAERLGLAYQHPPLAVSFAPRPGAEPALAVPIAEPAYGNLHGAPRRTCRLCGECDIGCNDGAKNSLDHTYLSAARHHGADIRVRCEVRAIRPGSGGGYEVRYVEHDPADEGRRIDTRALPSRTITCDRLVLAAGTYGSTYLLLRNRRRLPGLGAALGTRFSGNGDLLGLLRPPPGDRATSFAASRGPVITTAIRVGDAHDGDGSPGRGFYLQDGGYPGFVDWMVESSRLSGAPARRARFAVNWLLARLTGSPRSGLGGELARLLGDGRLSAGSLPLLGMGRDVPDGVLRLRGDHLDVSWTTRTSAGYFSGVRSTMRAVSGVLGGRYADNPAWWLRRVVTVHPLGGAPMGRHPGEGVCDGYGEVFGHPGLHVLDGSTMPGPVGANPSLTIAAVADRAADRLLREPTAK
ncbi:GMC oxidoreductase [Micromonospora sp. NPDC050686]|uniref:GMC oxidoreductase n=1 Tax=Micromonospora sp. NPDC050686 TaxID=3154631 RepID=UPI0033EF5116